MLNRIPLERGVSLHIHQSRKITFKKRPSTVYLLPQTYIINENDIDQPGIGIIIMIIKIYLKYMHSFDTRNVNFVLDNLERKIRESYFQQPFDW